MKPVFDDIRIVELAQWVFVPSCGALLSDLGADVLKVEDPRTGDPARGLHTLGLGGKMGSVDPRIELNNRGKRSVALNVKESAGRETLLRLIESADVFLTSLRPSALERLELSVDALRERNPKIIYARGHGVGVRGPDANMPCYDATAFWARGGIGHTLTPPDLGRPLGQRPAFGDHTAAMNLAFGIAGALFRRAQTGEPSVVDVSLLATAMWVLGSDVTSCGSADYDPHALYRAAGPGNPFVGTYSTSDDRHLSFVMLQPDRYWEPFCRAIGREDLLEDVRFADSAARRTNGDELAKLLREEFAKQPYEHWQVALRGADLPWAPVQTAREVRSDPQTVANGYLAELEAPDGSHYELVGNPCQFDEEVPELTPAPEVGAHTEEVLLEVGMTWDEIARLRDEGGIL